MSFYQGGCRCYVYAGEDTSPILPETGSLSVQQLRPLEPSVLPASLRRDSVLYFVLPTSPHSLAIERSICWQSTGCLEYTLHT